MRARLCWLMMATAACSHHHAQVGPDGAPDASADAMGPPCAMPATVDTFDVGPPCATWGYAFIDDSGGDVKLQNGALTLFPGVNAGAGLSHMGCSSTMPVEFSKGAWVEARTAPSADEYMTFYAGDVMVQWSPTMVEGFHNFGGSPGPSLGAVPWDSAHTTWVRIRPSDAGDEVVIEASGDGRGWVMFALDAVTPPATASIELVGGTSKPSATPAPIVFEGLSACPQ